MTLAIFRTKGKCPVQKDILKILLNCSEMLVLVVLKFLQECCLGWMIL